MGTKITVTGADYSVNNINNDLDFDVMSAHVSDISFNKSNNILSLKNSGAANDFNWIASSNVKNATVTMSTSVGSEISNSIVIGIDTSGNALVLFLEGSGYIAVFPKTGVYTALSVAYNVSPVPTVAKGSPITIALSDTTLTISYSGYSKVVNYSNILNFAYPAIGVLVSGTSIYNYTFIVN